MIFNIGRHHGRGAAHFFATFLLLARYVPKALVTLSRLGGRPQPTLIFWKGLVRSVAALESSVAGLVRSWEVGELGRGVPDCFELFKTVGSVRE